MMNYEDFKKEVAERFMDYMPEEYRKLELRITPVKKVNRVMDGLSLINEKDDMNICPTFYINEMYDNYKRTCEVECILKDVADCMVRAIKAPAIEGIDYTNIRENIVFQLVNTEWNRKMLSDIPHRQFLDLSIIYRWIIKNDENGIHSTIIKNNLMANLGLIEEDLYRLAMENTKSIFPPKVKKIGDVLREEFSKMYEIQPEDTDMLFLSEEVTPMETIWVISNKQKFGGAAYMLYGDELQALADFFGSDLYILPSSIDEVLAVSADCYKLCDLAQIVPSVNMSEMQLEKRLSNQIYRYDRESRSISIATNAACGSLNG